MPKGGLKIMGLRDWRRSLLYAGTLQDIDREPWSMEAVPTAMNEAKSMRRVQTSTCYKREDAQRCTIIIY